MNKVKYKEPKNLLIFLATLQKYLPRGKGTIPRIIGKLFANNKNYYLTTKHGAKLVLSPSSYDVYATMHLNGNTWDYEDFRICSDSLPDKSVYLEIGANVGYFAIEAAYHRTSVKVYAFEPQQNLVAAIKASITLNDLRNIEVIDALVGNIEGMKTLYIAPSSIHSSAVSDIERNFITSIPKSMVTIDGLIKRGEISPPDFVKMDVEGSEALVFQGGSQTFREHRPNIFLEYLVQYDIDNRVIKEVEALVQSCEDYTLYGIPNMNSRHRHKKLMVPINEIPLPEVHGLYIRNMKRLIADDALFHRSSVRVV